MDDQPPTPRYWCYECTRMVSTVVNGDAITCLNCTTGFVQELDDGEASEIVNEHAASLWASMLLNLLSRSHGSSTHEGEAGSEGSTAEPETAGGRVILVDPARQGEVVLNQGVYDSDLLSLELLQRYLAGDDTVQHGTPPAEKRAVKALPMVKVPAEGWSCPVCLEEMKVGSSAKEMPCRHRFHDKCIIPWLEIHGTCPICRFHLKEVGSSSGGRKRQLLARLRDFFSGRSRRSGSSSSAS